MDHQTTDARGAARYYVRFRVGGREIRAAHGGVFQTMKAAKVRRDHIVAELAARRVPALAIERDAATDDHTRRGRRALAGLEDRRHPGHPPDLQRRPRPDPARARGNADHCDYARVGGGPHRGTRRRRHKKQTIRETIGTLAMVLDYERIEPNPASRPRLPHEQPDVQNFPMTTMSLPVACSCPPATALLSSMLDATGSSSWTASRWATLDEARGPHSQS